MKCILLRVLVVGPTHSPKPVSDTTFVVFSKEFVFLPVHQLKCITSAHGSSKTCQPIFGNKATGFLPLSEKLAHPFGHFNRGTKEPFIS